MPKSPLPAPQDPQQEPRAPGPSVRDVVSASIFFLIALPFVFATVGVWMTLGEVVGHTARATDVDALLCVLIGVIAPAGVALFTIRAGVHYLVRRNRHWR